MGTVPLSGADSWGQSPVVGLRRYLPAARVPAGTVRPMAVETELREVGRSLAAAFPSHARRPLRALDERAM